MKNIDEVLSDLIILLRKWNISKDNWIFASQYALKLQGYDIDVRKGHLNIIINKSCIPWTVGEALETHPPTKSDYSDMYRDFINTTGFEFDILPAKGRDFIKKMKNIIKYKTKSSEYINLQNPRGDLKEVDNILSKSDKEGWGLDKGYRVYPHLEDVKKSALKRKEFDLVKMCNKLQEKYRRFRNKVPLKTLSKLGNEKQIMGISASKGKIVGKVNIVLNPEKTKDFLIGDILVTKMTSPKFTPYYKKASAIITDEGGMLCHAAIVAREMGIPCIVGAKIATKLLENGDLIEVDAEEGFIRRLNK